ELNLPLEASGIVVLDPGPYGARVGLRAGDISRAVNRVTLTETPLLAELFGGQVRRFSLLVQRGDRRVCLRFRV
ncbi:MAG: serine protease, partial [Sulfitobacter sp.]|nr:serine protease [Sulfitobacter sp.]